MSRFPETTVHKVALAIAGACVIVLGVALAEIHYGSSSGVTRPLDDMAHAMAGPQANPSGGSHSKTSSDATAEDCDPQPEEVTANEASRVASRELAEAVRSANDVAGNVYGEKANAWRKYLAALRQPKRLKNFVGELTSLEQKFQQGVGLFDRTTSEEQRVLALFRQHVVDERQLVADMQGMVEGYEAFLFEQDRALLVAAGVPADRWSEFVGSVSANTSAWNRAMQPVVATAVSEAQRDVARFVASWVAADLLGDGIKGAARHLGLDTSEPGSLEDFITGLVIDGAAGAAIDYVTDPTDEIVAKLGRQMAQAEQTLLDGDGGLFAQLRQLYTVHAAARNQLVTPVNGQ